MGMLNGESKVTFNLKIEDQNKEADPFVEANIVWNNVDYQRVIFIETHLLNSLVYMADGAAAIADDLVASAEK